MLSRFFMIFAVMVLVTACSTDDEAMMDDGGAVTTTDREGITAGPLDDIYGGDNQGPAAGTQADLVVNVGDRIFYGYDRYDLTPEARTILDNQANWLRQYPDLSITIEGHADERGTREYNLALGERRANSVKSYLMALGVSPLRVNTISYGKERPAVPGSNDTSWAQNRRGVTKVD
ncbi:MAG: peptidoglycan-associated lipoprotein [Micavibrio sp.]|nr:MAG: peptidoglycan-associated lipoprotein [Micavibrio sp.]